MKLIKQPETQLEYWEVIEELGSLLGGLIFRNILDPKLASEFIEKNNFDLHEICFVQNQMLIEIVEKFGVTRPYGYTKPNISPGQVYYWDWYDSMKKEFSERVI